MSTPSRPKPTGRWVIACINWDHPDALHAALFRVGADGSYDAEFYVDDLAAAWRLCDRIRRRVRLVAPC